VDITALTLTISFSKFKLIDAMTENNIIPQSDWGGSAIPMDVLGRLFYGNIGVWRQEDTGF
jgi:hypothetical protein